MVADQLREMDLRVSPMNQKIILNPISSIIKEAIEKASHRLNIAVPFISPFTRKIVLGNNLKSIKNKKVLTRFDETNINSFELPTLEYLIDHGFKIRYDNNIHLKLYIFDDDAFVTSSNLTKGGLKTNIELTVQVDNAHIVSCSDIFNNLWDSASANKVTKNDIADNMPKYHVLKKRKKHKKNSNVSVTGHQIKIGNLNIERLTDEVFIWAANSSATPELIRDAHKCREDTKKELKQGFDPTIFYVPENHIKRKENLFYDFVYGCEEDLAGTG